MRKRVYVAGPITKGNVTANVRAGIEAGLNLLHRGYAIYIPHFSYTVDPAGEVGSLKYEAWLENDFAWIAVCDALLRLPGESAGADREVAFAFLHNVPVFHTIEELEAHFATGC